MNVEGAQRKLRPFFQQAVEKRSSAALRCKPHRSTYFSIRLALDVFARLA
jgi:hypothetical protein